MGILEDRMSQRLKLKWGLRQSSREYMDLLFTWEAGVYCFSACVIFSSGLPVFSFYELSTRALIPFSLFSNGFPVPPHSLNVFFFPQLLLQLPNLVQISSWNSEIHKRNSLIFPANPCLGRVFMCQITSWVNLGTGQVLAPVRQLSVKTAGRGRGWGEV